jgi:hypothetical protein
MATLDADVAVVFDPSRNIGLRQFPSDSADTYFRGGLAHHTASTATLTPTAAEFFLGVIMEHRVTAAAAELVWVATSGRFHFANGNFEVGDLDVLFQMPAAALFDNPADLDDAVAGAAGGVGVLDQVTVTATSGWLDISRRVAATNT